MQSARLRGNMQESFELASAQCSWKCPQMTRGFFSDTGRAPLILARNPFCKWENRGLPFYDLDRRLPVISRGVVPPLPQHLKVLLQVVGKVDSVHRVSEAQSGIDGRALTNSFWYLAAYHLLIEDLQQCITVALWGFRTTTRCLLCGALLELYSPGTNDDAPASPQRCVEALGWSTNDFDFFYSLLNCT